MYLKDNGVKLRDTTPFRHGLLLGGVMDDDNIIIRLDVVDPVGSPVTVPGSERTITFDRPSLGMMAIRKTDRATSLFFPMEALAQLQSNATTLVSLVQSAWLERGGEAQAVARNVRALVSALNGDVHQPDSFGTLNWAPSLSMPFGLVMAGDWMGAPEAADVLTYTVEEAAQ